MSQDAMIPATVNKTDRTAASVAVHATDTSSVVDTASLTTNTAPTTTSASSKGDAVSSKHMLRNSIVLLIVITLYVQLW